MLITSFHSSPCFFLRYNYPDMYIISMHVFILILHVYLKTKIHRTILCVFKFHEEKLHCPIYFQTYFSHNTVSEIVLLIHFFHNITSLKLGCFLNQWCLKIGSIFFPNDKIMVCLITDDVMLDLIKSRS